MKNRLPACLLAAALAAPIAAHAQNSPVKPIRIVTSPAGGGNDFPARLLARALAGPLGPQIVVGKPGTVLLAGLALLKREVGNYLRSPEAQKIFLKAGTDPSPGSPEEFTAIMKSEVARIGAVLKAAGPRS